MKRFGTQLCFFINRTSRGFAALVLRLHWRISSKTSPFWSTARHSQNLRALIVTTTTSRYQISLGWGCRWRKPRCNRRAKFCNPPPDRFERHVDTAFEEQFPDFAKAHIEPAIKPNRVRNDLGGKAVTFVVDRWRAHPESILGNVRWSKWRQLT